MPAWSMNRIFTWASPASCQLQMDFPEFVSHFGITLHPSYPRFQAAARISQLAPAAGLIHPKPSGKKAFSLVGLLTLTEIILAGMKIAFPHVAAPEQTVFDVSAHVFEITSLALLWRGYRGVLCIAVTSSTVTCLSPQLSAARRDPEPGSSKPLSDQSAR
ncbi:hypothetical protein SRHO_G00090510 [Serrasalmus rhombeus]